MRLARAFAKMETKLNDKFGEEFTFIPLRKLEDVNYRTAANNEITDPERPKYTVICPFEMAYVEYNFGKNNRQHGARNDGHNALIDAAPTCFPDDGQIKFVIKKNDLIYRKATGETFAIKKILYDGFGRYTLTLEHR
ncbi:MAG: hypothetical protein HRU28_18270 [Rhizobiales bacterium]|nr:hypothetical protein [Hyphomicrobiales bacterium]